MNCLICNRKLVYTKKFCSKKCMGLGFRGKNNPNHSHIWDKERKRKHSEKIKSIVNEEYRKKCAKANKGKIFSEERRKNISLGKIGLIRTPHTEKSKKLIGIKSKKKFTKEYLIKQRQIMEKRGYWIPLNQIPPYQIYCKKSNWIRKMWNLFNDLRLKEHGIFNPKTNKKGLVRDHIFSRRSGFKLGVFPEIMRHPCNCQLLTHSENIKKKIRRYEDADHQTIDQLIEKIKLYKNFWFEQEKVLRKIEMYQSGYHYTEKGGS